MGQGRSDPRRNDVVAWMASTGRGYKAAAKHFGLPTDTVKTWQRKGAVAPVGRVQPSTTHQVDVELPPADVRSFGSPVSWVATVTINGVGATGDPTRTGPDIAIANALRRLADTVIDRFGSGRTLEGS